MKLKILLSCVLFQMVLTPLFMAASWQPITVEQQVDKMVMMDKFRAANPGKYLTDFESDIGFNKIPRNACKTMVRAGNDFSHGLKISIAVNGIPAESEEACNREQNKVNYLWIEHDL